MKQFLRYIFLLVAMIVATANAWAECVIFSENGSHEMMDGWSNPKSKEFTISNPRPCNQLVFKNEQDKTWATGGVKVTITYADGSTKEETKGNGTHTINLNRKIVTKLHFKGTGTLKKTLSAITLTQATYVDAPMAGGAQATEWYAGTDIVGNKTSASATIDWSDATFSCELQNNTDSQFSVSPSSEGATCSYGSSTITATYLRTKPGNHSATLLITASTGDTYTIALSGVTGKYTPQAAKKMDMVMNESYNPSDIFDVYYLANNVKNTISDYTVKALDPTIANYVDGKIVTNYQTGTARFQLTREADTNFDALNTTISVNVNPAGGCLVLEPCSGSYSAAGEGWFEPTALSGPGDYLSFQARSTNGTRIGSIKVQQYVNGNWEWVDDANPDTDWRDYGYTLNELATHIRFYTKGGSYSREFRNVQVTRKQILRPQIDGETFYLTQVSSGMQFAGTFPLAWSTCSDEIRFSCDNPNFVIKALDSNNQPQAYIDASNKKGTTTIIVTYSANTANPVLTGELTIYDQSQTKTITLSCEHLTQTIDWPQYFHNLEADEEGVINQDFTLNAIARAVNGQPTNQPIKYTLSVSPSENAQLSSDGRLIITGICEGTITASVEGFTDSNGRTYSASSLTRQIRIRKAGTPCHSYALYIVDLQTITLTNSTKIFSINGLPENSMTFIAHTDVLSVSNDLSIDFSKDGNTWGNKQTIDIKPGYEHSTYSCSVPDSVSFIRFQTGSTLRTFFDMVTIRQKEYLTASVSEIVISDAIVNQPFSATFTVDYSDVPFIQYEVTNSHNLNLQLTPSPEINNNCGEHGTYTFTLTGMSPYLQENVQETITIFTSAGHRIEIPIIITSKLGDPYYFNQQDGNWNDLNNWRVNNAIPSQLPTPSNPVFISKAATIGTNDAPYEGIAYSITMEEGGSLTVLPKGGLTVHAGGFTGANENNLTLHNMQSGAGYIRISPYFTDEVAGTMPKIKVLYQTKSTLDSGANKDATWQYIGAPGNNTTIYVDYNTWLYKLDEQNADWVLQPRTANVALEPFEGYAITQYGQPTYQWTADITNENHTLPLTYSKDGRDGRHIFANSYTAPIDVKALYNAITYAEGQESRFRIDQTVYIFNSGSWNAWNSIGQNASGSTPGQYYAIPILAAAADYLSSDEQTVIPPMQGFYMRVRSKKPMSELSTTEEVGQIQLDYNQLVMSNRQIDNTPLRSPQRVEDTSDFQRARIHVTSATSGADRLIIIQDTINTRKYNNGYDAPNQTTEGLANIYTNESFGKMEVSCSDNIDSLYIGFMAGEDSQYTLHFSAMCGDIYLKDLANDSIILMQEGGQYHFTATPNSTNDLRFQILLDPEFDPSHGNGDILSDTEGIPSTQVWMHGNTIYIASAPSNSVAKLFNVSGHMIMTDPITYSPYTLDLSHLTPGVYMLQLNNQIYKFIRQ